MQCEQGPHKPGRSWGMGSGSCVTPRQGGVLLERDRASCARPWGTRNAHDMVHIDREVVHGSFPPPRYMEGLCWQREPSSSGKHFEEDGIKKVANEAPGGSNTGFIRPLPSCRITLLWLCTFGFMDYKGEQPWCSRRKITGACLNSPLALIEQDPGTAAIRVKRSRTLIVGSRTGSPWPRPFWQPKGSCGKSKSMPATYGLYLKQEKGTRRKHTLPSGLLPWRGFRRRWKWAREVIGGQKVRR